MNVWIEAVPGSRIHRTLLINKDPSVRGCKENEREIIVVELFCTFVSSYPGT